MLESLSLHNVGPAATMELQLGERLNLITGDNGLGKSFLLDVAWWVLTRRWPRELNTSLSSGHPARPTDPSQPATIEFRVRAKSTTSSYLSTYDPREQAWTGKPGRPLNPGLVVYALADGGFAVWDPARNYWRKKGDLDVQDRLPAYVFGSGQVWDGLEAMVGGLPTRVCNGLIADWASWIRERGSDAARMAAVLATLTPTLGAEGLGLRVGDRFGRLSLDDARDIPMVRMDYGHDVMILHASLGVRRIVALAYMLTWAWREHLLAAEMIGDVPTSRIVLLFDEVEAHLHPRWQRQIIPAILRVVETLTQSDAARVQLIAATHSPLVLASLEPEFDRARDAWFDIDLVAGEVRLQPREFVRLGDASSWLTSEAFGLFEACSLPAEQAMRAALELLRRVDASEVDYDRVEAMLAASLGDTDRFWLRWTDMRRRRAEAQR
jgi:hypothetical protein